MRTCVRMAHAPWIREKARELRAERRLTIDQIAERLVVSRTTVFYWVRDLPIPGSGAGGGFSTAAQRRGTRAMQARYRLAREEAYAQGAREFPRLSRDVTFRDFVCLYIAEGYKRDRNAVALGNSDPAVVGLSQRWIAQSRGTSCPTRSSITSTRTWPSSWRSGRSVSASSRVRSGFSASRTATSSADELGDALTECFLCALRTRCSGRGFRVGWIGSARSGHRLERTGRGAAW
jgi:hypothetical protein